MIALGIIDSKPSAAAVVKNGQILAAVAEERLCRQKLASGMPRAAIAAALQTAGVTAAQIDAVAVAQKVCVWEPEPIPWKGWFDDEDLQTRAFDNLSGRLAPLLGRFPIAWKAHHRVKSLRSQRRTGALPQLLKSEYDLHVPVTFFDHHYCHATSAYFTSGFREALVVTLDGGGDGLSGSVYLGRDGQLTFLSAVDSFNSLGNFYSYITELCGFSAEKHEGKITGLAALGEPIYADTLRQFIRYEDPGKIRYRVPMYHRSALQRLAERLPATFDKADLAASVQQVLEETGSAFVDYWLQKSGMRQLALAGGVFANVKFNQRLHKLDNVSQLFVHPAMDDSGLSVGSALALIAEQQDEPARLVQRLPHVYVGPSFDHLRIKQAITDSGCANRRYDNIHDVIGRLLAEGHVVARFQGRMEYGPRALGNRSILYQTTDPSVNDWLNRRLQRTEFMPFAPATLVEEADRCYAASDGARDSARFMTITFDCTAEMKRQSPGVVHVDGTARPQLVDAVTSPDFHKILTAYFTRTGIPSLINTSFNMHEEPIVCTPEDALRSFQQGHLDYLAIDDWLVTADPSKYPLPLEPQGQERRHFQKQPSSSE